MTSSSIPVLIVGAGPTGLMLACELARARVRFRIVDKAPVPSPHSRALVLHARSLELLQKLDVDRELVRAGQKTIHAHIFVNQQHAADIEVGDTGIDDTPFPFVLFVSQAETERVLARALVESGTAIERGVEAVAIDPAAGEVTLDHNGTREVVQAQFVVGCDGAHSAVRHAGDFSFEGEPYPQDFLLADVHLRERIEGLHLFFDDRGVFVVLPLSGDVYRIISTRVDAPRSDSDPSLAEVQSLADAFSAVPLTLIDPVWLARFRLHHRQANRYRWGPLFLAGDAAHIHSPAGGQGMNTGIQDAANLAWKLALVVRGEAPERLLDTYHDERHPVGRQLLRTTDRLFSFNTSSRTWMKWLRNFTVTRLAGPVLASRPRRALMFRFLSQLRIAYRSSPIVVGELGGRRAPDAPLDDQTVFAHTREHAHHLLVFADRDVGSFLDAIASQRWLRSHVVRNAPMARERYQIEGEGLVLVRPDGYIGMSSPTLDPKAIDGYAARLGMRGRPATR